MSTTITIQTKEKFEVALLLGARAFYMEGEDKEYYPALEFRAVELPHTVSFPREFRIKNEAALPTQEEAIARARVIMQTELCQAVANMILADYAQEP